MREKVIKKIKRPGKKLTHQAMSITPLPSLKIDPKLISGGRIPNPKKLNPDSAKIAPPTPNVKEMKNIGAKRGAKYFNIILYEGYLAICRIFMKGFFPIAKLSLLIILAFPIHPVSEITTISTSAEASI